MSKYENEIYKSIEIIVYKIIKKLRFDKTRSGIIVGIEGEVYTVDINGVSYNLKARDGLNLEVGDIVYVKYIQGMDNEKYIDCKRPI